MRSKCLGATFLLAAVVFGSSGRAGAVELILNGGFEDGSSISGPSTVPNDWTPNAGYTSTGFNQVGFHPHTGTFNLNIGNDSFQPVPLLSQTFADVNGSSYSGSLFVAYGGAGTTDTSPFFNVFIDNIPVVSLDPSASAAYTQFSFVFTGTGSDTLTLGGNTNPSEWFVDDVSVTGAAATPLPSTWTMLISGFVGLGFLAYRGTKRAAALATA